MRILLLVAIALAACGSDRGAPDCPSDLAAARAAHCKAGTCGYDEAICDCGNDGFFHCRPSSCPDVSVALATPRGAACPSPDQCDYEFELGCGCVLPDNRWLCCTGTNGAGPQQPSPGDVCCDSTDGYTGPCRRGVQVSCDCFANHYRCSQTSCDESP